MLCQIWLLTGAQRLRKPWRLWSLKSSRGTSHVAVIHTGSPAPQGQVGTSVLVRDSTTGLRVPCICLSAGALSLPNTQTQTLRAASYPASERLHVPDRERSKGCNYTSQSNTLAGIAQLSGGPGLLPAFEQHLLFLPTAWRAPSSPTQWRWQGLTERAKSLPVHWTSWSNRYHKYQNPPILKFLTG